MRRELLAAFAIVASVLVLTQPVAASHALVVASSHTTDTDFNAGTLTNMTVTGSGTAATVELTSGVDQSTATTSLNTSSPPGEGTAGGVTTGLGLLFVPTTDLSAVLVNVDDLVSGATRVQIKFHSNGTVVATETFSGTPEVRVDADLSNGVEYRAVIDDAGGSYTRSFADEAYNISSANGNITAGWTGSPDTNDAYNIEALTFVRSVQTTPGEYISANHTVENSEQGFVNITELANATATVTWETSDGGAWSTLNQTAGITSAANHTFSWSVESNSTVRVNVTVQNASGNGEPAFTLADEGVQFTAGEPTVNNSSASPTGDLTTTNPTLEIDANDTDFPLAQGDSVEVEFFVDGSSIGTDTLTSNGTASATASGLSGGDHTWHVVANDSYGHEAGVTSQTFDISTPGNLTIRDEQNASRLVTDAQVNVTAYFSGEIVRRNTTTGQINLTGLPVDEPLIIRASADGYYTRTVVIEDVFQQQSVYLLNNTVATYEVRFDLQDATGDFDRSDTVLFVDRDINLSGSLEWRTIAGDEFGIEGVPVDLVQGERFRIRIKNLETGTTAILGKYTAIQSETVTLSPASATFDFGDIERAYTWEASENETSQKIIVEYSEENSSKTADVKITIHERFNESNVLVDNQTFTDTSSILFDQPLTADQVNKTWSLVLYVDRGDGYMRFGPEAIGSGADDLIPADLDEVWRASVGVFLLLISSMAFSELNRGVGAIATALVGGMLWWIGLLGTVAIGPAVVFAIGVSVAYKYRLRGNA